MKHVLIHHEPGLYFGQPANVGIWRWGLEILVGFNGHYYHAKADDNAMDRRRPGRGRFFARSLDGGESWTMEDGGPLSGLFESVSESPVGIEFTHPDFALAVKGLSDAFAVSYDRGRSWVGAFKLPDLGQRMKSRTDTIVYGSDDCLFMLSTRLKEVQCKIKDRVFCARTRDGGKNIEFQSYVTTDAPRSVMPSTVRMPNGTLVTALRRRWDADFYIADSSDRPPEFKSVRQSNWLDAYRSSDEGMSWEFLSLIAFTDVSGRNNGNPPAMVLMGDGRLCVVYGFRGKPLGIRAKISEDAGVTWSDEIILRDDAVHWDLGYCRMVQRPDGKLVTVYYIPTDDKPEQHIEATIWHPDEQPAGLY